MDVKIRPLRLEDLQDADHIMRVAFGTFTGLPDPASFGDGTDFIRTRWLAAPDAAFGAELNGKLVGSVLATKWGSFGFFGPLTVHPNFWDQGIAKRLLEPTMELFRKWGVTRAALFTLANSPKHIGLYEKFGFWPRFLTPIMSKSVQPGNDTGFWSKFSNVQARERRDCLANCRSLADSIYEGLDLEREIVAVDDQKLGDTVLLWQGNALAGFAVCQCGTGTEAGKDVCYIKFGTVGKGSNVENSFDRLLNACDELARMRGMTTVLAGVNTACHNAYRRMIERGFRTDFQGVMMLRPNEPAFDRSDCYVICDLR